MLNSLTALFRGGLICVREREVRRLAIWPWLIGAVTYMLLVVLCLYSYLPLLHWIVPAATGIWNTLLTGIVGVFLVFFLSVMVLLCSLIVVLVFAGTFQSAIATHVLQSMGVAVSVESPGLTGTLSEIWRSLKVETLKLLWLLPLGIGLLVIGFIPLFAPVACVVGVWLLAYQFLDTVLDVLKVPVVERLRFARKNCLPIAMFGMTLSVCCLIPLVGMLLPPVAVAGAAWLVSTSSWGKTLHNYENTYR